MRSLKDADADAHMIRKTLRVRSEGDDKSVRTRGGSHYQIQALKTSATHLEVDISSPEHCVYKPEAVELILKKEYEKKSVGLILTESQISDGSRNTL